MTQNIVQTKGITKIYSGKEVVKDLSINIQKGDIYGFIGENGAGKTTFMKILVGLAHPNFGTMQLFGGENFSIARKKIGSVIENPALFEEFSVYDNLQIFRKSFGIKEDNIKDIIRLLNLQDTGKKPVKNFSLGMRQRVSIGIALLGKPKLLILDEPLNGLDPDGIQSLRQLLIKLNHEKSVTILISSHILGELSKISTKYGILHGGRLIKEIDMNNFEKERQIHVYINAPNISTISEVVKAAFPEVMCEILSEIELNVYSEQVRAKDIMEILYDKQIKIHEITNVGDDLEQYVSKLMKGDIRNEVIN